MRESKYDFRGICVFKTQLVRTNAKLHCITTKGIYLWNNCCEEMKTCTTLSTFKQIFIKNILNRYRMNERRG